MSAMTLLQDGSAVLSGGLVGFVLGLIGGGGSILAVPLLIYVVGVASPHIAIGTSAVAVAAAAALNLIYHARAATVRWPCAAAFSAAGVIGAAFGARLGLSFDGQKLLALFGAPMPRVCCPGSLAPVLPSAVSRAFSASAAVFSSSPA